MLKIIPAAIAAIFMSNAHAWVWVDNQNTDTLCDDNAYPLKPKNIDNIAPLKNNEAIANHWQAQKNACIVPTEAPTPTPTPSPTPVPTPTPTPTPTPDLLEGKTKCGDEWQWCRFPDYGVYDVWFGDANELSAPKTVEGFGVQCNEGNFSDKDIKGSSCYIKQGVAPSPTPVPTPTPTPTPVPTPVPTPTPTDPHQGHNMTPFIDVTKLMSPRQGSSELKIITIPDSWKQNWPDTYTTRPDRDTGGAFRVTGQASHMSFDDSILYPNQPGKAHLHTFFCNVLADAYSTPESLKTTGNSTCQGGIANRSAYWLPTPIDTIGGGIPLVPSWAIFYYKGGQVRIPNGLMMIAGNHEGSPTNVQDDTKIYWSCNAQIRGGEAYYDRKPYILPCSGDLMATVTFPNCWDGKRLNTPNGKDHMAYGNNGTCPATHPVSLPNVTANVHYNVPDTEGLRLSSDNYMGGKGGYSLHFDYMFAWHEKTLETWQINCLDKDQDCHAGLLGDGRYLQE